MYYTIEADLNVIAHDARPAEEEGRICFATLEEFRQAATNWPIQGFVDLWNDMAGVPPFGELRKVKRFENRGIATKRIFAALEVGFPNAAEVPIFSANPTQAQSDAEDAAAEAIGAADPTFTESNCATPDTDATIIPEEEEMARTKTKAKKTAARAAKPKAKAASAAADGDFALPTKKETIISLVCRKKGATISEIMDATGWQKHSVRGFIATLNTKGGFAISSDKNAAGERVYQGGAA